MEAQVKQRGSLQSSLGGMQTSRQPSGQKNEQEPHGFQISHQASCYGMNAMSAKIHLWDPYPQCDDIRRWGPEEVIQVRVRS